MKRNHAPTARMSAKQSHSRAETGALGPDTGLAFIIGLVVLTAGMGL